MPLTIPILWVAGGSALAGGIAAYTLSNKVSDSTNIILIAAIAYLAIKGKVF